MACFCDHRQYTTRNDCLSQVDKVRIFGDPPHFRSRRLFLKFGRDGSEARARSIYGGLLCRVAAGAYSSKLKKGAVVPGSPCTRGLMQQMFR